MDELLTICEEYVRHCFENASFLVLRIVSDILAHVDYQGDVRFGVNFDI